MFYFIEALRKIIGLLVPHIHYHWDHCGRKYSINLALAAFITSLAHNARVLVPLQTAIQLVHSVISLSNARTQSHMASEVPIWMAFSPLIQFNRVFRMVFTELCPTLLSEGEIFLRIGHFTYYASFFNWILRNFRPQVCRTKRLGSGGSFIRGEIIEMCPTLTNKEEIFGFIYLRGKLLRCVPHWLIKDRYLGL